MNKLDSAQYLQELFNRSHHYKRRFHISRSYFVIPACGNPVPIQIERVRGSALPKDHGHFLRLKFGWPLCMHKLVLIREWSWHPRPPLRYGGSVPIRHLHLRQRCLIQDMVLQNHAVLVE